MTLGSCRYCGCEEDAACPGGCAWTDAMQTLCTTCLEAEVLAEQVVRVVGFAADVARPRINLVDATAGWVALTPDQKQLLVMTVRAIVERLHQTIAGELETEVRSALIELDEIAGFLQEACPEALRPDESISVLVRRLLKPHVGSRLVLP